MKINGAQLREVHTYGARRAPGGGPMDSFLLVVRARWGRRLVYFFAELPTLVGIRIDVQDAIRNEDGTPIDFTLAEHVWGAGARCERCGISALAAGNDSACLPLAVAGRIT